MDKNFGFLLFAYGFTAAVIAALVVYIIADYRWLRRALSRFPARDGDARE